MLRRLWKPVLGTTIIVGAPSYLLYKHFSRVPQRPTFDYPVRARGPDGAVTTMNQRIPLLSQQEAEQKLTEHAEAVSLVRRGVAWKQSTAFVASNDPIEDANASKIIERDPSPISPPGDLLFFAVMDGHAGYHTSRLLAKTLIPAVALELATLINESEDVTPSSGRLQGLRSLFWRSNNSIPGPPLDADPQNVALALQRAFTRLDSEIVDSPLRILAEEMVRDGVKEKTIPNLIDHPMARASMLPAMSGSCAILALFDTAHENLFVASTGDCRAVAGVWEEDENGHGSWRADVLTEDQTGRNPSELKRMQSEHPADEADTVIMRGRVLGGLEPTRAFGDARYKWTHDVQALLNKAFLQGTGENVRTPSLLKTPPYVTARPVVTHRKLRLPNTGSTSAKPKSSLRFIVLATDGLWDELSSDEVVALVGGYLKGLDGVVAKTDLHRLVPVSGGRTVEGKDKHERTDLGSWAFIDKNLSTHLIRNALRQGDDLILRRRLSIPAPLSRRNRDDITCTVVYWEEPSEGNIDAFGSSSNTPEVKAKL